MAGATERELLLEDFAALDDYAILGVVPGVTADALHRAFRQQMAQYHPDRHVAASAAQREYVARRSARIGEAYRTLTSTPRRGTAPVPPRKHLEDLYVRASTHLAERRALQAAATLRQLLALDPQYRDAATVLARAEIELEAQRRAATSTSGIAGFAARFLRQRAVGEDESETRR